MRILKTILIVLLALAWVPLSLHCQIESLPGWEFLACESGEEEHSSPHQSTDCADDFCQVIESGFYKTEERASLLPQPIWIPHSPDVLLNSVTPNSAQLAFTAPTLSPPVISASWQFYLRAALPVRAPSLAS